MKTLCVLQHDESEYLGLMEDHLESRNIRFRYFRPFTPGGTLPEGPNGYDGLIVLGAGPFGIVSGNLMTSLGPELRLVSAFLEAGLPVVGIGLGAAILSTAAGGGATEAPLRFALVTAHRTQPGALSGHLPERWPMAIYMRDRPVLPSHARVLAASGDGEPLVFQTGDTALGFIGHPGIKSAMIEDLIMEFEEAPENTAEGLEELRQVQSQMAEQLTEIMVGLIKMTHWMD